MANEMLMSLFEEQEAGPVSVSELNSEIRSTLERRFPSVWVEGEITNFHSAPSGHWYFSLSDGDSIIKAACFKGQNYKIRYKPEDGNLVRVRGRVSVYAPRGEYQLIVESLEPAGAGALALAFEQVKSKLQAEGLFDESLKRPLPPFPKRIGVVTSPTGAAVHDILTVLERRARSVSVIVIPTLVQGDKAGEQIVSAIEAANDFNESVSAEEKIDVLIVGRGGGSAEDLWAFNEERVARAIRSSAIPVISAVGHEVDFSISDFAADVRAATPSAAAEIVVEKEDVVAKRIESSIEAIIRTSERKLILARQRLATAQSAPVFHEIPRKLRDLSIRLRDLSQTAALILNEDVQIRRQRLVELGHRLSPERLSANVERRMNRLAVLKQRNITAARKRLALAEEKLKIRAASLDALSPLSVLTRGFSLTRDAEGRIVRDAAGLKTGDKVNVKLLRGSFESEVLSIEEV